MLFRSMGGIGKTHICRKIFEEYVNNHAKNDGGSFKHIGYIEYNGDMGSSLQKCLKFKQQDSPEQNLEAAWKELEHLASDGKLLLFVDNVNTSIASDSGLERLKYIPGAIILTSRRTSFSKEFMPYRIGFLSTEQCRQVYETIRFENSGKRVKDEDLPVLEYIIEKLAARHTITIELLACLARAKRWTVNKLKEALEKNGFRLEYIDEEDKLINIQECYETLYDLSELTKAEQNILEAFSIFPYIPLEVEMCNQWLLADAGVNEDDDILMKLYQKGWLQFDIVQEGYSLHPVFAQFIYAKCKPIAKRHTGLIHLCEKSLETSDNGHAVKCQICIPFAESIIKNIKVESDFMVHTAYALENFGHYEKAENLYEKALNLILKKMGISHPNIVSV